MSNPVKFELDAREFTETLNKYVEVSKKDAKDVVLDRASKVAYELFKSFKKLAPSVSLLQSLPEKLNYRIRRKFKISKMKPWYLRKREPMDTRTLKEKRKAPAYKGMPTVAEEIRRRINARFAAAVGWLPAMRRFKYSKHGTIRGAFKGIEKFRNPRGRVEINLSEPSVTLYNSMKEAVAAEARHHAMQSALNAQNADMRQYIERKLDERARQFSAR